MVIYNDSPKNLYVLRMNTDGQDVLIEEHELAKFPKLQVWFNNPQRYSHRNAVSEEMELVNQCLGAERIVNYDTEKFVLEQELKDMKQSLNDYTESVLKVEKGSRQHGTEGFQTWQKYGENRLV